MTASAACWRAGPRRINWKRPGRPSFWPPKVVGVAPWGKVARSPTVTYLWNVTSCEVFVQGCDRIGDDCDSHAIAGV